MNGKAVSVLLLSFLLVFTDLLKHTYIESSSILLDIAFFLNTCQFFYEGKDEKKRCTFIQTEDVLLGAGYVSLFRSSLSVAK